jgi:hypothetical protein
VKNRSQKVEESLTKSKNSEVHENYGSLKGHKQDENVVNQRRNSLKTVKESKIVE